MKVFLLMLGIVNKRKKLVALPASATTGGLSIWTCLTHFHKKVETEVFKRDS